MINYNKTYFNQRHDLCNFIKNNLSHKEIVKLGLFAVKDKFNNNFERKIIKLIENWFCGQTLPIKHIKLNNCSRLYYAVIYPEDAAWHISLDLFYNDKFEEYTNLAKILAATSSYRSKIWNNFIND